MAASDVSICSNALLMVGAQTINSLDDGNLSDRQRLCANLYPLIRDYLLNAHPWNCCRTRVVLNPDLTLPVFDYSFAYTLPADYSRMLKVGTEDDGVIDYRIENGKILCDQTPLSLRYCFLNQNVATWTPLMVMACTMAMQAVLAYPITQSTSLEQLVMQVLQPYLKEARAVDSTDTPPEELGDYPQMASRFSNGW